MPNLARDWRLVLPALALLSAGLLLVGSRHINAVSGCAERAPDHTAQSRAGRAGVDDGVCASGLPEGSDTNAALSQLGFDAAGSKSGAFSAPADPLMAFRLSLAVAALPQRANAPARSSPEGFIWPLAGPVTQAFGVPELGVGSPHTGLDVGQDSGTPIRAAQAGRVVFAGGNPCCGLGYWIEINHGNHYSTRYGHLMRPPIMLAGDYVSQGQVIGFSGNTGFSTGPHLHFEVRLDGMPIDPLRVLSNR